MTIKPGGHSSALAAYNSTDLPVICRRYQQRFLSSLLLNHPLNHVRTLLGNAAGSDTAINDHTLKSAIKPVFNPHNNAIRYRFSGQNVKHLQKTEIRGTSCVTLPNQAHDVTTQDYSRVFPTESYLPLLCTAGSDQPGSVCVMLGPCSNQLFAPARSSEFLLLGCPLLSRADRTSLGIRDLPGLWDLFAPRIPLPHTAAAKQLCKTAPERLMAGKACPQLDPK